MSEEEVYDLKERLICKGWEEAVDYIEELDANLKEANDSITWWTNRYKGIAKEHRDTITRNEDYRARIDKAIEYNNHLIEHAKYHLNLGHLKKMKKILEGSDKE